MERRYGLNYSMTDVVENKPGCVNMYHAWVERVKKTVPKDRLLVFSVKEGWEPLCKFLDVPVPDEPFPRVNDTKSIQRATQFMVGMGYAFCALAALFVMFIFRFVLY